MQPARVRQMAPTQLDQQEKQKMDTISGHGYSRKRIFFIKKKNPSRKGETEKGKKYNDPGLWRNKDVHDAGQRAHAAHPHRPRQELPHAEADQDRGPHKPGSL